MKEDIKELIALLQEAVGEMNLRDMKDDTIFSKAIDVYLKEVEEKGKDARTPPRNYPRPNNFNAYANRPDNGEITPAQIGFLERLGYKSDPKLLTKEEAQVVIQELLNQKRKEGVENEGYSNNTV
jgi:hypothetical protein